MKSLRSFARLPLSLLLDIAITGGAFLGVFWLAVEYHFPGQLDHGAPDPEGYLVAAVVLSAAFMLSALTFQLYRPRRAGSLLALGIDVFKVHVQLALVWFAAVFYFREYEYSRQIISTFFLVNPVLIFLHHVFWLRRERRLIASGKGTRSCLIIGTGELAKSFANRVIEHPWTGLTIRGYLNAGEDGESRIPEDEIIGEVDDLEAIIGEHGIQEVILAVPFRQLGVLASVDERLSRNAIGLRTILDLEAFNTISREIDDFDGLQVVNLRGVKTYGLNAFVKRSLDLLGSAVLLILLAPFLGLIAALIAMTSGRPIIYRQERVGLDGMVFHMLKFRTMETDAEAGGPVWGDRDDPRSTRLGRLLRRTSLDELPQLWNVFRGQMSLVGPRPERPIFIEEFRRTIPRYMLRHHMKAGLTGWAQVNGWRGRTSLKKRLQYDLYYMRNWSIPADLKILFLTLVRAWREQKT